ncbi:MAG: GIY-YIG nuclease family protein [Patescibacteria group bacterium]
MYYTYVLKSQKDNKLYIGYSTDLQKRFQEHQKGLVRSTKDRRPFKLIFYEAFKDKRDAIRRERYFKTDKGKSSLKQIIRYSLINL